MAIDPISAGIMNIAGNTGKTQGVSGVEAIDFGKMFNDALNEVNRTEAVSKQMGELLAAGELENPHDATIAATEAELTLNYVIEVKNRVVEAYKELMRMQL